MPHRPEPPAAVLEALRLLVVVFFAGAGHQLGSVLGTGRPVLGALNGTAVGLVVGSGLGYVLGGVLGRSTTTSAQLAERRLRAVPADTLVAGALGAIGGVLLGAGVSWPLFFIPSPSLAFPLFGFVVVALGYAGSQLGASKRDEVLSAFGGRTGVGPRAVPAVALDRVLDTSVAIDGRIVDVVRAGFLHGRVLLPTPVLAELQGLADAGDDLRRAKGRRGLDVLEALRREPCVEVVVVDDLPGVTDVDTALVRLCLDRGCALLTLDTNLAKVAALAGAKVLNLHALALALRPPVVAGEEVGVLLLKSGKESGQAVGYLDDGTMVVVERARHLVGKDAQVHVTSVVTTANGRLVFGRLADEPAPQREVRARDVPAGTLPTTPARDVPAGTAPTTSARDVPAGTPPEVPSQPRAAVPAARPPARPTPADVPPRRRG